MSAESRFRVCGHTKHFFRDSPKNGKAGTLMGMAFTPELADRVVRALNIATDPTLMIQALVDSGLTGTEIVAEVHKYRQEKRKDLYPCPHHGVHPHADGHDRHGWCARCRDCQTPDSDEVGDDATDND
jgi:hypothetical protein